MPSTTRPLFEQIDTWLQEVETVKSAAAKKTVKKAAPSGMGESKHITDDVEDHTQDAETGERFEENSKDVKADIPASVDATDAKGGGSQDDKQYNIGTTQSAVGEDPSVEDDYKGDKDDPGTSHPADAESTGEKYSSYPLSKLLKMAEARAHDILADLANNVTGSPVQKTAAAKPSAKTAAKAPAQAPVEQVQTFDLGFDKVASDFIAQTIKDAELDADLTGSYLVTYVNSRQKKAEEDSEEGGDGDDHAPTEEGAGGAGGASDVMPPEGAGGPPMGGPPGAGGGADILSALGAGGGGAPPGAGGMPPDAAAGGMPPDAGGGADPAAGGAMGHEQALQELAMALQELGISPEELAGMAQGQGQKLASAVSTFKRNGRFRFEATKNAVQRHQRDQIKDYIRELTGAK